MPRLAIFRGGTWISWPATLEDSQGPVLRLQVQDGFATRYILGGWKASVER